MAICPIRGKELFVPDKKMENVVCLDLFNRQRFGTTLKKYC